MFGCNRDDNADVGWRMIRSVLYTFGAFVLVAVLIAIAQNL